MLNSNMARIEKTIDPQYFQEILDGKKKYEIRLNDFSIQEGDTLILIEHDFVTKIRSGRTLEKKVTNVNKFKIGDLEKWYSPQDLQEKGIQIISLE